MLVHDELMRECVHILVEQVLAVRVVHVMFGQVYNAASDVPAAFRGTSD